MNSLNKIFARKPQAPKASISPLIERANKGDAEAQFKLAMQYIEALRAGNLEVSVTDAFDLLTKSAAQNYEPAFSYLNGINENQKVTQSPDYISQILSSANNGNAEACMDLVYRYATGGEGLEKSKEKEDYWWLKAAENGSDKALLVVGLKYVCPGKFEQGIDFLRKSAAQGNLEAKKQLEFNLSAHKNEENGV